MAADGPWAVVPARLHSSRLPRKVLADLAGKPMLVRVVENVAASRRFARVLVAVEDDELARALAPWDLDVVVTGPAPDGTSRVASVAPEDRAVVNVQADQPLVDDELLGAIVDHLGAGVVTLAAPWAGEPTDPARVKVVPGPDFRREWVDGARLHVGIYGFGPGWVQRCAAAPRSPRAERASLEQLSWLDAGIGVRVVQVPRGTPSVDTPADLERVRAILRGDPARS